ncbi:hypothetical protein AB0B94_31180 [Micromonospora sp. NPDC048986]|uniref:hypothetical protein n=1 Tax=Micromonospora sp. NPDC048986 TaxID=3155644 RepID=UPI0033D55053
MAEIEIPYVGGPLGLANERDLLADWELADGTVEGVYVHEHRPAAIHSDADPNEVHRYVLSRRRGKWEFIYEPDLSVTLGDLEAEKDDTPDSHWVGDRGQTWGRKSLYEDVPQLADPTDAEVQDLAQIFAHHLGLSANSYGLARLILDAGYRKVGQ